MTKHWLIGLILGCLWISLPANAQTFEDGYQSYVRNQYPVAELQFKGALKRAGADEEKSFILKFIGICQYMRGDKKNSQQSFSQALTLDHNVQIDADEVLDPAVVTFFNSIKSNMAADLKKKPKAVAAPSPRQPSQTQAQASPTQNQQSQSSAPSTAKAKSKKSRSNNSSKKSRNEDSILGLDSNVVVPDNSRRIHYTQFLPFGFPQFHNNSYWLGGGVAIAQAAALYSFMDANSILTKRQALNDTVRNKEGLTDEQREEFYAANDSYMKNITKNKNVALAVFGATWAFSIGESLWNRPSAKSLSNNVAPTPAHSLRPLIQASRNGGTFGLTWQTQLK